MSLPIIERRDALALQILKHPEHIETLGMFGDNPACRISDREGRDIKRVIAATLPVADIVLWKPDLLDAAVVGAEAFAGLPVDASIIPTTPQWWQVDQSRLQSRTWKRWADGLKLMGILQLGYPPENIVNLYGTKGIFMIPLGMWHSILVTEVPPDAEIYRKGKRVALIMFGTASEEGLTASPHILPAKNPFMVMMYAALQFMGQEFITTDKVRVKRSRFKFVSTQPYQSVVTHVQLRRRVLVQAGQEGRAGDTRTSENQWSVRGHWRRLPTPRKADGQSVTYIKSYVKGNPAGEMLPPKQTIVQIKR